MKKILFITLALALFLSSCTGWYHHGWNDRHHGYHDYGNWEHMDGWRD